MKFGVYLRHLRRRANLTQGDLASKSRLSDAYVNQLETGKTDPPTRRVCGQLARALRADEKELWKHAFTARLERWLRKEGFKRTQENLLLALFEGLTKEE